MHGFDIIFDTNSVPYPPSNYGPSPNVPTIPLRNYGPQSIFNPEKYCEALHKAVHGLGTRN